MIRRHKWHLWSDIDHLKMNSNSNNRLSKGDKVTEMTIICERDLRQWSFENDQRPTKVWPGRVKIITDWWSSVCSTTTMTKTTARSDWRIDKEKEAENQDVISQAKSQKDYRRLSSNISSHIKKGGFPWFFDTNMCRKSITFLIKCLYSSL